MPKLPPILKEKGGSKRKDADVAQDRKRGRRADINCTTECFWPGFGSSVQISPNLLLTFASLCSRGGGGRGEITDSAKLFCCSRDVTEGMGKEGAEASEDAEDDSSTGLWVYVC